MHLVLVLFSTTQLFAQTPIATAGDGDYSVRLTALGAGMVTLYDKPPTVQSTNTTYLGNALCGRLVWHPDHLLAVGVQSGFVFFSADDLIINGKESGKAGLAAVPIHMVLTISSKGFEFGVGLGMYQLESLWKLEGIERATSTAYEYGVNPWVSYEFQVANRFTVGPEIGAHVLSNRGMKTVYLGLKVTGDVVRY